MCRRRAAILAALLLALVPAAAHAQSVAASVFAVPPPTDIWRHLLETLFPSVGPLGGTQTQGSTALAAAFGSFIAVLMCLGTVTLAWHIVRGIVATAHDGAVLGKTWHQVWAPVRVVLGVGVLAPVVNGFCLAQVLVVTIACWSGSFGNVLWSAYLDGLTTTTLSAPSLPATGALVRRFADAEICYAALSQKQQENGFAALPAVNETQSNLTSAAGIAVTAGNAFNYLTNWVSGGSSASAAQSNRTLVTWNYGPCGTIAGPFAVNPGGDMHVTQFDKSRLDAIESLRSALHDSAVSYVAAGASYTASPASESAAIGAVTSSVVNAKSALDAALTTAAASLVGSDNGGALDTFKQNAQEAGWVSAGTYYLSLARLQTRVQQVADTLPELSVAVGSDAGYTHEIAEIHQPVDGTVALFDAAYDKAATSWTTTTPDLSSGVLAGADQHSTTSIFGLLNWLFRNVFTVVDSHLTGVSPSLDAGSPLQQMSDFGSKLLSAATAVLGIGIVALLAGGGATVAGIVAGGPVVAYAVKVAAALAVAVLGVGALHAYILPMIPFVMWTFAIVQILALVAEAMVAAPLWAFVHLRMDGQELVGQEQAAGYKTLFSLFLRIPLTLLGLFLSMEIFQAGIWLLSITFYPAMLSATADSSAGIVGSIVMLLLISFLHWHLALRSFGLITSLPDRVSRWFGADAEPDASPHADGVRALAVSTTHSGARAAAPEQSRPAGGAPGDGGEAGGTVQHVGGVPGEPGGVMVMHGVSGVGAASVPRLAGEPEHQAQGGADGTSELNEHDG